MTEILLKSNLKEELDRLSALYETKDFIKEDPVQFIHTLKNNRENFKDLEITSFLAALFAFGKREMFIKKLFSLFNLMEMRPYDFVVNFEPNSPNNAGLGDFNYRFIKPCDLITFFCALKRLYTVDKMTLEELFARGYAENKTVQASLQGVCDYFYTKTNGLLGNPNSPGYKFMLSNPINKGAMKRMNMFLRWMVRKNSSVDLGVWDFTPPSELLIPLDVHVGNISRSIGLLTRKQNDFRSVLELTSKLKEFDPIDPIKYDFALFGYGVNHSGKSV